MSINWGGVENKIFWLMYYKVNDVEKEATSLGFRLHHSAQGV
jgi:hypothetical protein